MAQFRYHSKLCDAVYCEPEYKSELAYIQNHSMFWQLGDCMTVLPDPS